MLEALRKGWDNATHLRRNLFEKGHPYGLLLLSTLNVAAEGSSTITVGPNSLSSWGGLILSSSGFSDLDHNWPLFLVSSSLWLGSSSSTPVWNAHAAPLTEQAVNAAALLPGLSFLHKDPSPKVDKILVIGKGVSIGSLNARAIQYRGAEPFEVRDEQGKEISTVEDGDRLLLLHANREFLEYRSLGKVDRVKRMRQDFLSLCNGLEDPASARLSEGEQDLLEQFAKAPLLGVSHLVRLMGRASEIPTWGTEALPKPLRWAHAVDSLAVSFLFGGRRFVGPDDVRVCFITPQTRSQLLAA